MLAVTLSCYAVPLSCEVLTVTVILRCEELVAILSYHYTVRC